MIMIAAKLVGPSVFQIMETLPLIIVGLMALAFACIIILLALAWLCDRKATRQQQHHHSTYFKQ